MSDLTSFHAGTNHSRTILPGATIGILGGGQLGRMLALAALDMGYRTACLDPQPDAPCAQVVNHPFTGALDDQKTALKMASFSDVLTYEFENVDLCLVRTLETQSYLPQGEELLHLTRHRLREKRGLVSIDIPVAPFQEVTTEAQLNEAVSELGLPAVLKTATGGYDGKGQIVIKSPDDLKTAWHTLSAASPEFILEQWVPFEREISVVAARSVTGEVKTFPAAENIHEENILRLSMAPARISEALKKQAAQLARIIATKLNVVGLIAIEMFVTSDGELWVNELAPRPHNSGHYTMDACTTSQFEQHIRAICGLPLGETRLLQPVVMLNLLGEEQEQVITHLGELPSTAKLHLYGKAEVRPKRKMGHINFLADSVEEALETIRKFQQKIGWQAT